jgi:hypothetical protein
MMPLRCVLHSFLHLTRDSTIIVVLPRHQTNGILDAEEIHKIAAVDPSRIPGSDTAQRVTQHRAATTSGEGQTVDTYW